jgi:transketolase
MRRTSLDMVYELAKRDPRVVFIGSDLGAGVLDAFKNEMPDRFFMEGVSEANIIGMAAGLAMDGFVPYVNTIATFLTRRCYEQVAVDLCLHNLPVRLIANGGGMVYAPLGPTHIATEDIAIMRALPNMTVVAPADAEEMARLVPATLDVPGPVYIRVAKGGDPVVTRAEDGFEIGKSIRLRAGDDVLFVGTGVMTGRCIAAAEILAREGIAAGVIHVHTVKPLDAGAIIDAARDVRQVVVAEEHTRIGGLGSAVTEALVEGLGRRIPAIHRAGIPDVFTDKYGSQDDLLSRYGLQPEPLADIVRKSLVSPRAA